MNTPCPFSLFRHKVSYVIFVFSPNDPSPKSPSPLTGGTDPQTAPTVPLSLVLVLFMGPRPHQVVSGLMLPLFSFSVVVAFV